MSHACKVYTWGDSHLKRTRVLIRNFVDCEQSLFSSEIRGDERKTSKRAEARERDVRATMPWAASSVGVFARLPTPAQYQRQRRHDHSHTRTVCLFCVFRTVFEEKWDCSQSRNFEKENFRGTKILFCGRSSKFLSPLRWTNSLFYWWIANFWCKRDKIKNQLFVKYLLSFFFFWLNNLKKKPNTQREIPKQVSNPLNLCCPRGLPLTSKIVWRVKSISWSQAGKGGSFLTLCCPRGLPSMSKNVWR